MKYWIKTHWLIRRWFNAFVWDIPSHDTVYLTFDDGPTQDVTPWVLDQLKRYDARATFFCIGDCIRRNPGIFERLIQEGHTVGNHTYNHLNAWKTDAQTYFDNIGECQQIMAAHNATTHLFRPPYGKLRRGQVHRLKSMGYHVIMWDVLSADFDVNLSPTQCAQNVLKHVRPGSVVIFHDSVKASPRLREALPATLKFIMEKGWKCEPIRFAPEPGR